MENTPPRRGNQERNYTRNANNTKRKRTEEKQSRRNENSDGNPRVSRQLIFDRVTLLADTVSNLQQIQKEDKEKLLDQIQQLRGDLERLKGYIDFELGTLELQSKPNDLKY